MALVAEEGEWAHPGGAALDVGEEVGRGEQQQGQAAGKQRRRCWSKVLVDGEPASERKTGDRGRATPDEKASGASRSWRPRHRSNLRRTDRSGEARPGLLVSGSPGPGAFFHVWAARPRRRSCARSLVPHQQEPLTSTYAVFTGGLALLLLAAAYFLDRRQGPRRLGAPIHPLRHQRHRRLFLAALSWPRCHPDPLDDGGGETVSLQQWLYRTCSPPGCRTMCPRSLGDFLQPPSGGE